MKDYFKGILRIALILLSISLLIDPAHAAESQIGQMVWVKGTVKAMGSQGARTLQRRSPIYAKDTITMDKGSSGQMVFSDNSLLALAGEASMKIEQYAFGKNVPAANSKFVANLAKGSMRTITGLIPKNNPDNYQVNTPVATIGVTGTQYAAVVNVKGQLYVKYLQGTPCVKGKKGDKACLSQALPYASVPSADVAPITSTVPPTDFADVPNLTPGSYSPSTQPGGSKVVPGFCIG